MRCPKCDLTVEPRRGMCINIERRFDAHALDRHGTPLQGVPVVHDTVIYECERCDWYTAGFDFEGVFIPDDELFPLSGMLQLYFEYEQRQERNRRLRGDPGE